MTLVLHTPAAPQVPGCESGHAPKQYPAGRVCALPGCTTILRRTHAGPVCDPCQDNGRCEQRGNMDRKEREAAVLDYLRPRDDWTASAVIADDLGINRNTLMTTLSRMAREGKLASRVPALGGGYRLAGEPMDTTHDEDAPDGPSGAAPVIPPPEQPADVAPASEPLPPQARLAPFAGIDYELVVIGEVIRRIESLTGHETRVRVAAYVASRFL